MVFAGDQIHHHRRRKLPSHSATGSNKTLKLAPTMLWSIQNFYIPPPPATPHAFEPQIQFKFLPPGAKSHLNALLKTSSLQQI